MNASYDAVNAFWQHLGQLMNNGQLATAITFYENNRNDYMSDHTEQEWDEVHYTYVKLKRQFVKDRENLEKAVITTDAKKQQSLVNAIQEYCTDDPYTTNVAQALAAGKVAAPNTAGGRDIPGMESSGGSGTRFNNLLLPPRKYPWITLAITLAIVAALNTAVVLLVKSVAVVPQFVPWSTEVAFAQFRWAVMALVFGHFAFGPSMAFRGNAVFKHLQPPLMLFLRIVIACLFVGACYTLFAASPGHNMPPEVFINEQARAGVMNWFMVAGAISIIPIVIYSIIIGRRRTVAAWNTFVSHVDGNFTTGEKVSVFKVLNAPKGVHQKGHFSAFTADVHFVFPVNEKQDQVLFKRKGAFKPAKGMWVVCDDDSKVVTTLSARTAERAHKLAGAPLPA